MEQHESSNNSNHVVITNRRKLDISNMDKKNNRLEQISILVERYRKQVEKSFRDFAEAVINLEKAQQQEVKE